mmetsp:Transcript_6424/g.11178  ORF Transcript_6424/g.11178 Transcript_6424/m.11178 type:complete len:120 (+) Transcript_6424:4243-4602(+)
MCENWYSACADDWFESSLGSLDFCSGSSLLCSPLSLHNLSPRQFCEAMQVPVKDSDCYAGVPAALIKGKAPLPEQTSWLWFIVPAALLPFFGLLLCFCQKPLEPEAERMRRKRVERLQD